MIAVIGTIAQISIRCYIYSCFLISGRISFGGVLYKRPKNCGEFNLVLSREDLTKTFLNLHKPELRSAVAATEFAGKINEPLNQAERKTKSTSARVDREFFTDFSCFSHTLIPICFSQENVYFLQARSPLDSHFSRHD